MPRDLLAAAPVGPRDLLASPAPPPEAAAHEESSMSGDASAALAKKPGWTYGGVVPIARDPEGGIHLSLPDVVREPLQSLFGSAHKLEHGQVPQVQDYMPAVLGAVGSGIRAPSVASGLAPSIIDSLTPKAPPAQKAQELLSRALQRDNVPADNAAKAAARYPDKGLTVMDTGGSNVTRLARTVRTLPGDGSNDLETFLTERQNDQHNRVLGDITSNFANGADAHTMADKLMADRAVASKPLYDQAFKANQSVTSPMIDRILETPAGKKALADARVKMQNDMSLMGVPDAELRDQALEAGQELPKGGVASGLKLRTLDYVKQALDDQVGVALRSGESGNVGILTGLKKEFVKALDDADITARAGPNSTKAAGGLYAQARASYSGPSQSLDAITNGQDFLKMDPETLAKTVSELSASDKDFFRVGAARALQEKVNGAADNADVVPRVFGNKTIRAQIAAVFGPEATTKFAEAASAEKMATATNRTVRGGSDTASKLADISDNGNLAKEAALGAIQGGVRGAIMRPAMSMAGAKLNSFFNGMTPEVRNALADLLTRTGPEPLNALKGANVAPSSVNYGASPSLGMIPAQILNALLAQPPGANRPRAQ